MKVTQILQSEPGGNDITLHLLGEDSKRYALTVSQNLAFQMTVALRQAASRLPRTKAEFQHNFLYTLISCQPIAAEGQKEGIALTTQEGFEIPL